MDLLSELLDSYTAELKQTTLLVPLTAVLFITVLEIYLLFTAKKAVYYLDLAVYYGFFVAVAICFSLDRSWQEQRSQLQGQTDMRFDCLEPHWAIMVQVWPGVIDMVKSDFCSLFVGASILHAAL